MRIYTLCLLAIATCLSALASTSAAQVISTDRRDHVYNPTNGVLYISTNSSTVRRYDTNTETFLSDWTIAGGDLNGLDITPDGNTLLVADRSFDLGVGEGLIHRVDTGTGTIQTEAFALSETSSNFHETGSWDVVAMSNTSAFFSTDFVGSASNPFREWDLASNIIATQAAPGFGGDIRERTWLFRNEARTLMLALESNTSGGASFTYDPASDTYPGSEDLGFFPGETPRSIFHSDGTGAVTRDGNVVLVEIEPTDEVWALDRTLGTILAKLPDIDGGIFADPNFDLAFGFDTDTDEVVTFSTVDWSEVDRVSLGTGLLPTSRFDGGVTSFNSDTGVLYVSVSGGILGVQVSSAVPEPTSAMIVGLGLGLIALRRKRS